MKKELFIKTTGIYEDGDIIIDHINLSVDYQKNKGYILRFTPCSYKDEREQMLIDNNYFIYGNITFPLVEATRKSKSKELQAVEFMHKNLKSLLQQYIEKCIIRGGKEIKIA